MEFETTFAKEIAEGKIVIVDGPSPHDVPEEMVIQGGEGHIRALLYLVEHHGRDPIISYRTKNS